MASSGGLLLLLLLSSLVSSSVGARNNGPRNNPNSRGGSSSRRRSSIRSLPDSALSSSNRQIRGPEWSRQDINKPKEAIKSIGKYALSTGLSTLAYAVPFLGVIQPHGTLIAASVNLALLPLNMLDKRNSDKQLINAIRFEFENLNSKMDRYHEDQKYNIWASSTFAKPEKHINLAWASYKTMINALLQAKTEAERDRHRNEFMGSYQKYEPAIRELHRLLTVSGASFTYNLGDLLSKQIKCHETDLREYTEFINKLIYKGIVMNQFYYKVKKIESQARVDEESKIAYDSALVMFQTHKKCIFDSIEYVKKDVETLINSIKHRSKLAEDVRKFLDNTYDRYDWMVVAFIAKNSKHRILETLNKHVREKLGRCTINVSIRSGVTAPITSTYSAVHAYIHKAHDSHNTQDLYEEMVNPEQYSPQTPYIYRGSCEKSPGVKNGKYVVLIKSDEELESKDPCAKLNCGGSQRGQCVPVPKLFLAMCQCMLGVGMQGSLCENDILIITCDSAVALYVRTSRRISMLYASVLILTNWKNYKSIK
uniref:EGF-like domain-containing protein n=1 Tax=Salarias fasciatus TaxID=181472 RepID=A0A672GKA0_SALFA